MTIFKKLSGSLLLTYGIIKTLLCLAILFLPQKVFNKIPFLKPDKTVAGLVLIASLLIFAVYSIIHGLAILNLTSKKLHKFLSSLKSTSIAYFIIGSFLIIFYSLVLFTKVNIQKNPNNRLEYQTVGLCGGITFFTSIFGLMLYYHIKHKKLNWITISILSVIIAALIGLTLWLILNALVNKNGKLSQHSAKADVVTLVMIPFNSFA